MAHASLPPDDIAPLPLHELIGKLLLLKPNPIAPAPWLLPGSGTLQSLNQQLAHQPLLDFVNYTLRGIGQVIFVNNPISGSAILILAKSWSSYKNRDIVRTSERAKRTIIAESAGII